MTDQILIRQERPKHTRADHSQWTWHLYVMNQGTREYESHTFTWTFADAIALADKVWVRTNRINPLALQEVPC